MSRRNRLDRAALGCFTHSRHRNSGYNPSLSDFSNSARRRLSLRPRRGETNRARDRLVVFQLRRLAPVRGQNLRTRMIERHEQATAPLDYLPDVLFECEAMILDRPERFKRDRSERDDDRSVDDLDLPSQKLRAVRDLSPRRPAVRARLAARVAERGVSDEDVRARESDCGEVAAEVSPRLIARKRHARPVAALTARSLAHEHHAPPDAPVPPAQHRAPPAQRPTLESCRRSFEDRMTLCRPRSWRCCVPSLPP